MFVVIFVEQWLKDRSHVSAILGIVLSVISLLLFGKRLGITVFQPRLKVCTFARTNYYEYGKQRQVQESP